MNVSENVGTARIHVPEAHVADPFAGVDYRRASNPSPASAGSTGPSLSGPTKPMPTFRKREKVRNHPCWTGEHLPRVKGLVVRQQDMMMQGADFFPGPP